MLKALQNYFRFTRDVFKISKDVNIHLIFDRKDKISQLTIFASESKYILNLRQDVDFMFVYKWILEKVSSHLDVLNKDKLSKIAMRAKLQSNLKRRQFPGSHSLTC